MIVLDTHVLLWLVSGSEHLGKSARRRCDELTRTREIFVPAVSFWEIAMLVQKNRIKLPSSPSTWRSEILDAGLTEIPLDGATAIAAPSLQDFHADPADRFIVASALKSGMTLLTADEQILEWRGELSRQDARR